MKHIFQLPENQDEELSYIVRKTLWLKDQIVKLDYIQIASALLLIAFGILFIYSSGQHVGGTMTTAWEKQVMWALFGLLIFIIFSYSDYNTVILFAPIFYIITIILLLMVLVLGTKIYGAKRWLNFAGVNIQPSEFAKVATLLMAARITSMKNFNINNILHLGTICLIVLVPFALVLVQPDLGSALVFLVILASVTFAANLSWKWIFVVVIAIVIAVPSAYPMLKDYQKERILVFLDPDRDPLNQGWTSRQTLLSVGSGGLTGKGILKGTQNTLGFLPKSVSNSDLIFSVIAEETGFMGSCTLLFLYAILIFSMLRAAYLSTDESGFILSFGTAALFFQHTFINIGMNIRLMPITGIPLPLVSYGGSFMVTAVICLGMLQSVYIRRKKQTEDF